MITKPVNVSDLDRARFGSERPYCFYVDSEDLADKPEG